MTDLNLVEEGGVATPLKNNGGTSNPATTSNTGRKRTYILISILIVVATILALSLGLGLGLSDNDHSKSLQDNESAENKTNSESVDATQSGNGTSQIPGSNTISVASRLSTISSDTIKQTYTSCDSLKDDLLLLAQHLANRTIQNNLWYFNQQYDTPIYGDSEVVSDGANTGGATEKNLAAPTGSSTKSVTESNFGTNNQVEGVEEGDLVQSDGDKVFVTYGTEILVLDANAVTVTSRTEVPPDANGCKSSYIPSMILIGERLIVIATSFCDQAVTPLASESTTDSLYLGQQTDTVHIFNSVDMSLVTSMSLDGSFISARAIGENVHIVSNSYIDIYVWLQYFDPWREDIYGVNVTEAQYIEKAKEQVDVHLQEFVDNVTQMIDCNSLQKLALLQNSNDDLSFSSYLDSVTHITSFAVTDPLDSKSVSSMMLPSGGYTVYASADYLILAVQGWWVDDAAKQETYLISYKLSGPFSNATAIGSVPGYLLNQFSIDHAVQNGEDYLRVASTTFEQWAETNGVWEVAEDSTSQVTVLKIDSELSNLIKVGQVSDLGKTGETIYSVRFFGNQGFVTTFKTTDPFYTIDLSDPENPTKAGELEIPGFSSYLHPIEDNLIIGVGQETDSNGTALGVQISLFDVSNFSNPVRLQSFSDFGGSNVSSTSYSDAQYDHKAFRYLNSSQLLIIPLTIYNYIPCNYTDYYPANDTWISPPTTANATGGDDVASTTESVDSKIAVDPAFPSTCYEPSGGYDGFRVFEVTTEGISTYLSIQHDISDWYTTCWSGAFLPTRSLVFEGDLMTMKSHTILSHDLSTMSADAPPINLDNENTVCEPYILF